MASANTWEAIVTKLEQHLAESLEDKAAPVLAAKARAAAPAA